MNADLTATRAAAEAAFAVDATDENLAVLAAASEAEMDAYLAGFDARHAARKPDQH